MMRSRPSANSCSSRRLSGHGAADLVEADAELVAFDLVDAEFVERLADVEIALAGGDDADLRVAAARGDGAVELVGAHEREHGVALEIVQAGFLRQDRIVEADVETAVRHRGNRSGVTMLIRSRLASIAAVELDGLVHRLERHPGAGEARHGPAVEAVIENLLNAGRVQDRDHHVDEVIFGLVRGGGGFGGVVVAHQRQHAAVFRRSRRSWRGGTRRRCGRRRAPCRTTWRTRHRICPRRAVRPAASPTPRSRPGLR